MYQPRGMAVTEVGDLDVITHNNQIHLFHLTLPNHDIVTHAISDDGFTWTEAPFAIHTGDPGDCDDDMIWTMHTVTHPSGKGFHMYYTGCARAERGNFQRVALAFSDDLIRFTKHDNNPILEPEPPHYNNDLGLVGIVSFRDPYVYIEDGTWHMFVSGRTTSGPRFRRGCVVHATSDDGIKWELQKPLYAPNSHEDLEVISMIKMEGRYYMFFHDFKGNTHYRISESLEGPWRAPLRQFLLPTRNWVFRFCQWKGQTLIFNDLRATCDWPRRQAAAGCCVVPPPKQVVVQDNGELAFRTFDGWKNYYNGNSQSLKDHSASVHGQDLQLQEPTVDDFILEGTVTLDEGHGAGLLLRSDEGVETALWLRLDYAQQRLVLHKHTPFDSAQDRIKLRVTELQSVHAKLDYGKPIHVRVLACKQYIEVSLDDVVYLCDLTYAAKEGMVGSFIEDGNGAWQSMTVQPLNAPWDVWKGTGK